MADDGQANAAGVPHTGPLDWHLVADIGGTNARFGLEDCARGELQHIRSYGVEKYGELGDALAHFLCDVAVEGPWSARPLRACLAVACPVGPEVLRFTNSPWAVDRRALSETLGGVPVELINDFAAIGYSITDLAPGDWRQIGGGAPQEGRPIAVLGAGTGLGVCSVVPSGDGGFLVIEGEGGHVDFAPIDAQEIAVLEILTRRFGRVSAERLLSGAGLMNIYTALAELGGRPVLHQAPADITKAALEGVESLAVKSLAMFCRVLGSTAGNLALTLGARGGVYVAGGIIPRFVDFFEASEFRHRFEAKGRFADYLRDIPVRVLLKDNPGLHGAARRLRSLAA